MTDVDNAKSDSRRSSKYTNLAMKGSRSFKDKIALKNNLAKETLSEFFATCLLITLGCGCIASSVLGHGATGGFLTNNLGFAMAVTMAIYVSGGVSGRNEDMPHISWFGPIPSIKMNLLPRLLYLFQTIPLYIAKKLFSNLNLAMYNVKCVERRQPTPLEDSIITS
ncbi:aquaporin-9 isoform X1 [Pelobates cultripes]|uniref:Aquaporin-9 isoform X1 n=1 Tax=Pelobates cultripes TaxID=61616 RepID=A0AAD1VW75_PELCU|nr:aquaporin-9 isoform X1 [Pelobates cultripes]